MKKIVLFLSTFFGMLIISQLYGQGIRKHYLELTDAERMQYKIALDNVHNSNIREKFALIHFDPDQDGELGNTSTTNSDSDSPIHAVEDFLPWHRQITLQYEWELQKTNPCITVPYWDWTGESDRHHPSVDSRAINSPLWNNNNLPSGWTGNLIGEYNVPYNLNRQLGQSSSLGTTNQVDFLMNQSSFFLAQNLLEGPMHAGGHNWVGGQMATHYSPRDPVFYLHHSMIDKLWQDWEEIHGTSQFIGNNYPNDPADAMPTFVNSNGTEEYLPNYFQDVSPNDIVDSRSLGIFYTDAIDQEVFLDEYSVTNNVLDDEQFCYQYTINAEDFIIPDGRQASFHSEKLIRLLPGFRAEEGSKFRADLVMETSIFTTYPWINNVLNPSICCPNTAASLYVSPNTSVEYIVINGACTDQTNVYVASTGQIECTGLPFDCIPSEWDFIEVQYLNTACKTDELSNSDPEEEESVRAMKFYPNPAKNLTTLDFYLPEESTVTIRLFDIQGKEIKQIVNNELYQEGFKQVTLDCSDIFAGTYFCSMQINDKMYNEKLIVFD